MGTGGARLPGRLGGEAGPGVMWCRLSPCLGWTRAKPQSLLGIQPFEEETGLGEVGRSLEDLQAQC